MTVQPSIFKSPFFLSIKGWRLRNCSPMNQTMSDEISTPSSNPSSQSNTPAQLTLGNYRKGFLVDENWLAGVSPSENPDQPGFAAYVVNHLEGTLLAQTIYPTANEAITALNSIRRNWIYESAHQCGGGKCGKGGCGTGGGCGSGGGCGTSGACGLN